MKYRNNIKAQMGKFIQPKITDNMEKPKWVDYEEPTGELSLSGEGFTYFNGENIDNFTGYQPWLAQKNQSKSYSQLPSNPTQPTTVGNTPKPPELPKIDPFFALQGLKNGLSWLSGKAERNRQNQYMYNQYSTMGQQDPVNINDHQPNPYNLYAQQGGPMKNLPNVTVHSKDDPRLKAYRDSLNLYNGSKRYYDQEVQEELNRDMGHYNEFMASKFFTSEEKIKRKKPSLDDYLKYNQRGAPINFKGAKIDVYKDNGAVDITEKGDQYPIFAWDEFFIKNRNNPIKPTSMRVTHDGISNLMYKKPVQPVIYNPIQKIIANPEIIKSDPSANITNTNIKAPNIPIPSNDYRVQYTDPTTGQETHQMFPNEKIGSQFQQALVQEGLRGPVEGRWKKRGGKMQGGGPFIKKPSIPAHIGKDNLTNPTFIDPTQQIEAPEIAPQLKQANTPTKNDEYMRLMRNKQYQQSHPYTKIDDKGNLSQSDPERGFDGQPQSPRAKSWDRGLDMAMTSLDAAGMISGAGELASMVRQGLKKGLKKEVTEEAIRAGEELTKHGEYPSFKETKNLPDHIDEEHLSGLIKRESDWLRSNEYFRRKMQATGRNAKSIRKESEEIINHFNNTSANFTGENAESQGVFGSYISANKPRINIHDHNGTMGYLDETLDHEIKHAFSEAAYKSDKITDYFKNTGYTKYPNKNVNTGIQRITDPLTDSNWANQPAEQQVAARRIMDVIERTQGVKRGEKLNMSNIDKYRGYLNDNISGDTDIRQVTAAYLEKFGKEKYPEKLLDFLNKAYVGAPAAVGVGMTLQNDKKKKGGSIKYRGKC